MTHGSYRSATARGAKRREDPNTAHKPTNTHLFPQHQEGATAKDRRQAYNKQRSNSHRNFHSSEQAHHKSGEGANLVDNRERNNKSRSMSSTQMEANGDANVEGENAQKKRLNRRSTRSNNKSNRIRSSSITSKEEGADYDECTTRESQSIATLSEIFFSFLHSTPTGFIDVPKAMTQLKLSNQRRIYDILHVLQGIGVVEKHAKNIIYWQGGERAVRLRPEQKEYIGQLKTDMTELERQENELDEDIRCLRQSIRNVCEEPRNCHLLYSTHEEILQIFPGSLCIAVNAPLNASINMKNINELLDPEAKKYEMSISSPFGHVKMRALNHKARVLHIQNDNPEDTTCETPNTDYCEALDEFDFATNN
ncbi:e2F transcription factor CC-MB domain-containing protein [Ditylenchus destructor]|uniref:E2F transcription factor CC-MB domain-containing protein n=1 Tax=Ditylenchus destructor TaxID=166010 RepID=A0AAD4NAI0_9BILA|nr:e2F transcription factor CC-MB domain-containing protein [Ditylenchus destructor]